MNVQPDLCFDGRCEEAVDFYREALGAEVMFMMRFKDSPHLDPGVMPPGAEDKVFHMSFRVGDLELHAGDDRCNGKPDFRGFALVLKVPDVAGAERIYAALAEGGQIRLPLAETFWAPRFGIVTDRFGVTWKVQVVG